MPLGHSRPEALASSTDSNQETLSSLKKALRIKTDIIKGVADARKALETTGLTAPGDTVTAENIAQILLSLVVMTATKKRAGDKIPEKAANIIRATALLLDDITVKSRGPVPGDETEG